MKVNILAFGIAKDILGGSSADVEITDGANVHDLQILLEEQYARLRQLKSYMIAVNNEYAQDNKPLNANDEIAIIPPVSGG